MNLDLYADGRADVAALDNGAADPNVAREADGLERVVERVGAGIANQGMVGVVKIVVLEEFVEVGDIFELAVAGRSPAGEGPIAGRGS